MLITLVLLMGILFIFMSFTCRVAMIISAQAAIPISAIYPSGIDGLRVVEVVIRVLKVYSERKDKRLVRCPARL